MTYIHRWPIFALAALLLAWLPSQSRAQTNAITWQITPGFDGSFRAGAWFPLEITVANAGPDIAGATLAVRFRTNNAATYSQSVDLPHNANKRIVMPVLGESEQDGSVGLEVTLRNGATVLRSQRIEMNALGNMRLVVGVVSDEGNVLPELANLHPNLDNGFGTTLLRLASATLPDRSELLQSFDALFVHATDPERWSEAQRAALSGWISNGGQLVVGGDERVIAGLNEILPATAEGSATSTLQGLQGADWQPRGNAAETTVPVVQLAPQPTAEVVLRGDAQEPLLVRQHHGSGSVTMAAFGLESLAGVGDPATFWSHILTLNHQSPVSVQLREQGFSALRQALELPALRLPSILGFLGFLLLYIVTIGPLNYLLLRRLDRREWAYLTIPLLVLLFSGGAYAWGTLGRGRSSVLSELAVVRVGPDHTAAQAISYLALFSPSRHAYDVRLAPDTLVADLQPVWERQGNSPDVLFAEDSTRVPELMIDVGAVRALSVEHAVAAPQLEATVNADGTQLTVRNRSDQTLEDVIIARGDARAQLLDSLAPGEERSVNVVMDRFVQEVLNNSSSAIFQRNEVLSQLNIALLPAQFNGEQFLPPDVAPAPEERELLPTATPLASTTNQAGPAADLHINPLEQLFILGWQPQALTAVTLDGQPAQSRGETLYMWPVREER
ncbi:MAG: hypothetical protein M3R24_10835 [Chloroflexota bacterium]|nr:hypothetical protein [Chloroflexota bacterium]